MKYNLPAKSRSDWVYATINNTKGKLSFSYDPATDSIYFDEVIEGTSKFVRSYERESGKAKVLMEVPSADGITSFNSFQNLKTNFDHIIAVDTNTKKLNGAWISITVAVGVPAALSSYESDVPLAFHDCYLIARHSISSENEGYGWQTILTHSINLRHFERGRSLAVIVDSRLGDLNRINSRIIPYYGNVFLPSFATLVYASDAAADGLPNQMIKMCDSFASRFFQELSKSKWTTPPSAFNAPIQLAPSAHSVTVRDFQR